MSNTDNPYAAPQSHPIADESSFGAVRVDGDLLFCVGEPIRLPAICVITGETADLISIKKRVPYTSPVVVIVILLVMLIPFAGPILYAILLMTLTKHVVVTAYVTREVRTKRRWNMFYGVVFLLGTVGLLVGLIANGTVHAAPVWGLLLFVFLIAAIILLSRAATLLTVKKYEKPNRFWLKGCKQSFFETLAEDPRGISQHGF